MTEEEWLVCVDLERMMGSLPGQASDRRYYLFAVACCRRIWGLLTKENARVAVEVLERYADYMATDEEIAAAYDRIPYYENEAHCAPWMAVAHAANDYHHLPSAVQRAADYACEAVARTIAPELESFSRFAAMGGEEGKPFDAFRAERKEQCQLFRDVFYPFRATPIRQSWLSWNDGTLVQLAQAIYDDRAFDRLPILADALLDAGCTDEAILDHCRSPGPHVRGCWVVDLLLRKQ